MQNIDPLYFITPITVIAFSFGLVIYWHYKRCFTKWVLLYSLLAYAGAISLKYIVQIPTISFMDASFGNDPAILGVYYGAQTAIFEVGGAFLVAYYAVSRKHFARRDAGGYGIGLAFWENGILLGLPLLLNYIVYYAVLSTPNSSIAATLYATLIKDSPGLFFGPGAALPQIGFAILERVSSLLAHFSWGLLAVYSAVFKKKIYLALALPIGFFIDFLVPFAPSLGTALFELIVFLIALVGLIVAMSVAKGSIRNSNSETQAQQEPQTASLGTLSTVNFKRSINYGKIYLIVAIAISIGEVLVISLIPSSSNTSQAIQSQGQNLGITSVAALIIVSIYPVFSPLFAVIGSLGALMIFVSDKSKGVYEYLIAYGVNTSSIFWSIVLAAVGLASVVLVVSLSVVTVILYSLNHSIPFEFVELVLIYSIPLTYAATMFTTMIGMVWSSLTTRRAGINSPVGLAPMFGIFPIIAVFIVSEIIPSSYVVPLVGGVALGLIVAVAVMIAVSNKKMVRERFISTS